MTSTKAQFDEETEYKVWMFGTPSGMIMVVPHSVHHQSPAVLHKEFAVAMRTLPLCDDTLGARFAWQAGRAPLTWTSRLISGHTSKKRLISSKCSAVSCKLFLTCTPG